MFLELSSVNYNTDLLLYAGSEGGRMPFGVDCFNWSRYCIMFQGNPTSPNTPVQQAQQDIQQQWLKQ